MKLFIAVVVVALALTHEAYGDLAADLQKYVAEMQRKLSDDLGGILDPATQRQIQARVESIAANPAPTIEDTQKIVKSFVETLIDNIERAKKY